MARLFKALLALAILGFGALTVYAYVVDLNPRQEVVTMPVVLDAK